MEFNGYFRNKKGVWKYSAQYILLSTLVWLKLKWMLKKHHYWIFSYFLYNLFRKKNIALLILTGEIAIRRSYRFSKHFQYYISKIKNFGKIFTLYNLKFTVHLCHFIKESVNHNLVCYLLLHFSQNSSRKQYFKFLNKQWLRLVNGKHSEVQLLG